jgi:hypothetical protein
VLYEGSGLYGKSTVRRVSLAGGRYSVLSSHALESSLFGEGLTLFPPEPEPEQVGWDGGVGAPPPPPRVVQLTWQEGRVLTWNADTLQRLGEVSFTSQAQQGWGLTHDGASEFIMSDGSDRLHFWRTDAAAYEARGAMIEARARVVITDKLVGEEGWRVPLPAGAAGWPSGDGWKPASGEAPALRRPTRFGAGFKRGSSLSQVNELEYAHGWVLANIWYDARVAIIHPVTGAVVWYLDFSPLLGDNAGRDCLNGLAYTMRLDAASEGESEGASPLADAPWGGRLWVTGKLWNYMYEIELGGLVPADSLATL